MVNQDEWGRDPAVQEMRKVFEAMERQQTDCLARLGISRIDPRLRQWRLRALVFFNRAWADAGRLGVRMRPDKAGAIYLACLSKVLRSDGVTVPADHGPRDPEIERVLAKGDA